jgi:hypothetical protein
MFPGTATNPALLVHERLSFRQLLLLLSYLLLESSLLASIGNIGQIQDILARKAEDWHPHIGGESYTDMTHKNWSKTSRETRQAWEKIREYMAQQNLIDSSVSGPDLREMLGQLLLEIERISAQGINAARNHSGTSKMRAVPCSERGILVLICASVSVTTTPGGSISLRSLLVDPDQSILQEMFSNLPTSPLFHNGVSLYTLRDAFKSLDELFLFLSGLSYATDTESAMCSRSPSMAAFRYEAWIYRSEVREMPGGDSPPGGQSSGSRPPQGAVSRTRGARRAAKILKRRDRTSIRAAQDEVQEAPLKIQYYTSE